MGKVKDTPKLIKTKWGFYQYHPLPSAEELETYYRNKYFQEGRGSYEISYTEDEMNYFRLKASLIRLQASRITDVRPGKTLIDIGCGEGWIINEFFQHGFSIQGVDFSSHGIEKFHPHLIPFFEQGNMYSILKKKIDTASSYDFIILANVVEHVTDPVGLLKNVKKIMHEDSMLIIVAPNDFSKLQNYLIAEGYISRQFWLCYPDHLSYFNKDSMSAFLLDLDFKIHSIVADNPIDLNLLNDNSNYIANRKKGKNTHFFRVRTDNFLGSIDLEKLLKIYELLGSMGIGRDLNYYCTTRK